MAKTPKVKAEPKRREPFPTEAAEIKKAWEVRKSRATRPDLTNRDGVLGSPHSDKIGWQVHLQAGLGTTSADFTNAVLGRMQPLVMERGGKVPASDDRLNAALAILAAVEPQNELEAAMGEQLVGAHLLSMDLMSKASHTETIPAMEAYVNMATKLSRTFTGQIEALAKLRSGGKQQVIVKHEHIYINGPAVVGANAQAVLHGGGGADRSAGQSHAPFALTDGSGAAMLCEDPFGRSVPIASGEGPEAVQDARRDEPRRAEGQG